MGVSVLKQAPTQLSSFAPFWEKSSQRHLSPQLIVFYELRLNTSSGGQNDTRTEQGSFCLFGSGGTAQRDHPTKEIWSHLVWNSTCRGRWRDGCIEGQPSKANSDCVCPWFFVQGHQLVQFGPANTNSNVCVPPATSATTGEPSTLAGLSLGFCFLGMISRGTTKSFFACLLPAWGVNKEQQTGSRQNIFLLPCTSNPAHNFPAAACPWCHERSREEPKGKTKNLFLKTWGQLYGGRGSPGWCETPSHLLRGGDWPRQRSVRFDYNYCLNAELKLFPTHGASGNRQASKIIFGLQTQWRRDGINWQTSENPLEPTCHRAGLSLSVCNFTSRQFPLSRRPWHTLCFSTRKKMRLSRGHKEPNPIKSKPVAAGPCFSPQSVPIRCLPCRTCDAVECSSTIRSKAQTCKGI